MALTKATLDELCDWLPDPMLANQWAVTGIIFNRIKDKPYVNIFELDYLRMYVESIDFPFPYFDVTDLHVQTSKLYYPSYNNVNAISISFYEDNEGTTLSKLLAWQDLMYNSNTGAYSLPAVYKATVNLHLHNGKLNVGESDPTAIISARIKGVWPSQIEPLALSGESERIVLKATFSVDSVEFAQPSF